jgi:hypothetical protein
VSMESPARVPTLKEPEQDHVLFAPAWADYHVSTQFRAQLALMDELIREGNNVLMRCQSSSQSLGREIVVTVLFRQVLVTADAVFICLARGAVGAAEANIRHLLEARWGLRFALRDPDKWGLYLHVRTMRANREEQRRFIPGTPEWTRFAAARELTQKAHPEYDAMVAAYGEAIAAADAKLATAPLKGVNDAFVAARGGSETEPAWYCDGHAKPEDQVRRVHKLAKAVGCEVEYETAYKYGSYAVHGGHESSHRIYDTVGTAVAPLRSPESFRPTFMLATSQLIQCMMEMLDVFRPGELASFAPRVQGWQQTVRMTPDLSVSLTESGGR